ncbi:lysylphosphatidylglycerol synthase transmembrane domain-containing protein [Pseudomonadota bacterium]
MSTVDIDWNWVKEMLRHLRIVFGVLVCFLLLWFLFRDTDWRVLGNSLSRINFSWLLLAFILAFASLFARVQRWSYVVRATQPAAFRNMFSATQIGMLLNSLIPARLGDLARGFVFASLESISFTRSFTMVALDRINDVIALVAVLLVAALSFPSNSDIEFAAGAFGNSESVIVSYSIIQTIAKSLTGVIALVMLVLVFLYFQQELVLRLIRKIFEPVSRRFSEWVSAIFMNFAAGMQIFRSGIQMAKSVVWSFITWGLVALSFAALFKAFHLDFPWYGPFVMLAILGVFTSITVTPGMLGQYHVPVVASLLMILPGMNVDEAKAVAIVAHLLALLPPVVLGVYSMLGENLRLGDLIPKRQVKSINRDQVND